MAKKRVMVVFVCFLLAGLMLSSISVIAQNGNGNGASIDNDSIETETGQDEAGITRTRTKTVSVQEGGERIVTVERSIETGEEGEETKIKKTILIAGESQVTEIRIRTKTEDGVTKRIIRIENGEVEEAETELELDDEFEDNETTELRARLSNGRFAEVKILPNVASEIARERLRAKNFTLELKEVANKTQIRAAYEIQFERHAKLLGLFRIKAQNKAQVDAETGEIIRIKKPWWAFLATEEEEEIEEETIENQTSE